MARMTSFRFTVVDDAALNATFARHAGATRFAYNQCLRAVKGAEAKSTNPAVKVPWSGFDLINYVNAWKRSEAAGRTWAVDSAGVATLIDVGLVWRGEVCAQVFEEAAVDLGRGLDAFSRSRAGEQRGRRTGFPVLSSVSDELSGSRSESEQAGGGVGRASTSAEAITARSRFRVIGVVKVVEDTRRGSGGFYGRATTASREPGSGSPPSPGIGLGGSSPSTSRLLTSTQRCGICNGKAMTTASSGLDWASAWLVVGGTDGTELDRRQPPAPRPCAAQTASGYSPSGLQAAALPQQEEG